MKSFVFLMTLCLALTANAAILNLNSGESATIEANQQTTVICNGGSETDDCASTTKGAMEFLRYCDVNYSFWNCLTETHNSYPTAKDCSEFKSQCLKYCDLNYSMWDCISGCKNEQVF